MEKIYLENFRMINDPVEINIKPITILTGQNNSGKSSILKALLLLSDYLDQSKQITLDYNGKHSAKHKLYSFGNTRNWFAQKKTFKLSVEIEKNKLEFVFRDDPDDIGTLKSFTLKGENVEGITLENNNNELSISANLNYFSKKNEIDQRIQELKILQEKLINEQNEQKQLLIDPKNPQENIFFKQSFEKAKEKIRNINKMINSNLEKGVKILVNRTINLDDKENQGYYWLDIPSITRVVINSYYQDLSKKEFVDNRKTITESYLYYDSLKRILNFRINYLGPNRTYQSRLYLKENQFQEINEIIDKYSKLKTGQYSEVKRFLVKWLKEFGVGDDIDVKPVAENSGSTIFVMIHDLNDKPINLADKGYGAGQITTILLKIANLVVENKLYFTDFQNSTKPQPILIIEEPETNLHPSYQSKLAELFNDANKEFGIKFILETHSEYLIRKLQVLTANQILDPDQVAIYYLDNAANHNVSINPIFILPDGRLSQNFGKGFFDEAGNHTLELIKIRRNNSAI